ncbi:hypothetical protein HER10_EVM0012558 [Colletotrichum scovillei]|uniref:Aig2-like family protein n=1 Tax=Colletotrichum scovillei TaxID=1209932 RepID=A0A9P7UCY6_9PEZI|nr:uncharacterized protein HER10_EVM0012558 [Colletotrichum scovillei]KAF4783675.1 hypothetical protein HER10_EVM0012558 [Colletotrichum scovillei]KAG7051048.1 aig2-like family protein [Colletotrichum scovillei]KAG7070086.1 aig2-like family protein [Colletotrichum scovillei]KAG7078334.1 aig2-like family protein [Colletotrichum scovillei]
MSSDSEHPDVAGHGDESKSSISCGRCKKPGHELADCYYLGSQALKYGFVKGCPMCNTTSHCYDDCKLLPAGGHELLQHHMEWLVRRRRHMPLIYTAVDVWILVLGFPDDGCGYPWSRSFTKSLKSRLPKDGAPYDLNEVVAAIHLSDKLTESLLEIKRHINFTVYDWPSKSHDVTNLVGRAYISKSNKWENGQKHNSEYTLAFEMIMRQRSEGKYEDSLTGRRLRVLGAVSTYPAVFAKESTAWAREFGDFLLHDKPGGVDDVALLRELRDQAASRAAGQSQSLPPQEQAPRQSPPKRESPPSTPKTPKRQPLPKQDSSSDSDTRLLTSPESRAEGVVIIPALPPTEGSQTKRASPKRKRPAATPEPRVNERFPTSSSIPLRVRQRIWAALCPDRECVGGYPFEVPVPPIARLKAHVIDDLEDNNSNGNSGKRLPLANYIHPHVTISLTQRERPDGEPVHTLVLGLTKATSMLRFSRLGLLQAYDMAVCWASKVDKDGVSFSLRSAFDGCNAVTESFAGDKMRIEEMAELEKQIERLAPRCSQFEMVVERIKDWMERSGHKTQHTSREAWSDTLRKWWEDEHDDVGGLNREELKEACLQAIEAKMKEWKKEKKRAIEEPDSDLEIIESPPKKKTRSRRC